MLYNFNFIVECASCTVAKSATSNAHFITIYVNILCMLSIAKSSTGDEYYITICLNILFMLVVIYILQNP